MTHPKFGAIYHSLNNLFSGKTFGRYFDLSELIKIIKKNNKRFFELEMNLVYQDYTGDLKERVPLFRYIFDVEKHKSIEDCFKNKMTGSLTAIGSNDSEKRIEGEFSFLYDGLEDPKMDF